MKRFTLVFALSVATGVCQAQTLNQENVAARGVPDPPPSTQSLGLTLL
jgi:hypothetical protein